MNVSVAMATYNGEKYLKEQIDSIMSQLDIMDELIISDDGSTDKTISIIKEYQKLYSNIKLYEGPRQGVGKNFEYAIRYCNNEIIILSDQDDIWLEGKVDSTKRFFSSNKEKVLYMHNGVNFGKDENILIKRYKRGVLTNILKSSYWGCCMAFRSSIIKPLLPLEINILAHDQLIGLISERINGTAYTNEIYIKHRIHGGNQTYDRLLLEKIKFRLILFQEYIYILRKIKKTE